MRLRNVTSHQVSLKTDVKYFKMSINFISNEVMHISLFGHLIGHVSGAPKGGHFCNPCAKRVPMRPMEVGKVRNSNFPPSPLIFMQPLSQDPVAPSG